MVVQGILLDPVVAPAEEVVVAAQPELNIKQIVV
jgi:hypothetical protein